MKASVERSEPFARAAHGFPDLDLRLREERLSGWQLRPLLRWVADVPGDPESKLAHTTGMVIAMPLVGIGSSATKLVITDVQAPSEYPAASD